MQKHHEIRYETEINAPLEKVWDALTNPKVIKEYFFGTDLVTEWKENSPIYFRGEWEGKPYEDKGIVQAYRANEFLAFSYLSNWSNMPDVPENYLYITYTVQKSNGGTRLVITQTNYDEERAKHSEQNWAMVIGDMKKLVEK